MEEVILSLYIIVLACHVSKCVQVVVLQTDKINKWIQYHVYVHLELDVHTFQCVVLTWFYITK